MAPRPELAQLNNLCEQPQTLKRAEQLLVLVKAKTGPGTGHNIDTRGASLPAICAYLASVQLQNDDVSREVAQKASFLNPHSFANTLSTVRNALNIGDEALGKAEAAHPKTRTDEPNARPARFEDLARQYDINTSVVVGMREAVVELRASQALIAKRLVHPSRSDLLVCIVFSWACAVVGQDNRFSLSKLRNEWDITLKDWKAAAKIVGETCVRARANLEAAEASAKALRTPSTTRVSAKESQASVIASLIKGNSSRDMIINRDDADADKTPTAKPPLPTPSTSSPRGTRYVGAPPPSPSLRKTVAVVDKDKAKEFVPTSPSKRKVVDDEDPMAVDDETPRKRLFAPPSPSKLKTVFPAEDEDSEDAFEPTKLNFKKNAGVEVTSTPTKTRYIGQHPSLFFLSPSASPPKVSPEKTSKPNVLADSSSKLLTDTPSKSKAKAKPATKTPSPKKVSKPTRRITRSAARNSFASGFYYEDSDSELDSEEAANPARNLFTQLLRESDTEDDDDEREERTAARVRRNPTVPASRGRVAYVFRDRQALYAQDPVLTAKVRAWKRVQALSEPPVRTTTKRKERA